MGVAFGLGGAVLATVVAIAAFALAVSRPWLVIYPYLAVLVFFPHGGWGAAEPGTADIYARGGGQLVFPLVTWYLWGMALVALVCGRLDRAQAAPLNIARYFWLFAALFAGQLVVAALTDVLMEDAVSMIGLIGVVNMSLFFFVLVSVVRTPAQLDRLVQFLLICIAARGLYGLARFAFFGGDPVNPYANLEEIAIDVTFFDVNDSLLALLGAFIAAMRLLQPDTFAGRRVRVQYLALLAIGFATAVLSSRRQVWAGLLLAIAVYFFVAPREHRRAAIGGTLAALGVAVVAVVAVAYQRFESVVAPGATFLEMLFPDFKSSAGVMQGARPRELAYVVETILRHPVFGVGPAGRYDGYGIPWQVGEHAYQFVHSGFGHVALKGGLVGLALFVAMLLACVAFTWRRRAEIPEAYRSVYFAGVAGLAFLLPTLAISTPLTEIRSMQLLGLALALPYVTHRATRTLMQASASTSLQPARRIAPAGMASHES
ncbi:MAG: O-antigen ligase family protein [Burkholderiales bacterium]